MKTFDDIEAMGLHEPTIRAVLTMHYDGDLSREQALIEMVFALSTQKNTYFNEAVRLAQNSTERRFF